MAIRRLSTLLAFSAAFGLAHATFLNTLAWNRFAQTGTLGETPAVGNADALGNSYAVYDIPKFNSVQNVSYDYLYLVKYDISGNLVWNVPFASGYQLEAREIEFSPSRASQPQVFVTFTSNSLNTPTAFLMKFESTGSLDWGKQYTSGTLPLGVSVDSNGDIHTALNVLNGTKHMLGMYEFDTNKVLLDHAFNSLLQPNRATYSQGHWVASGRDIAATNKNGTRWGIYDETNGSAIASYVANPKVNGNQTTSYVSDEYAQADGFVYILQNDSVVTGMNLTAEQISVLKYDMNGNSVWNGPITNNFGNQLTIDGSDTAVYVIGGAHGTSYPIALAFNASNGSLKWTTSLLGGVNFSLERETAGDATGVYVLFNNNAQKIFQARLDAQGHIVWTGGYTTNGAASNYFVGAQSIGGNLYSQAVVFDKVQEYVLIQRFVAGVTLASLTPPSTVTGGNSATLTVNLNGNAPVNGTSVTLTSSDSHVKFTNNSQTITVSVPSGQNTLNVTLNTTTPPSNVTVTITGNQNGVIRKTSFLLQT